MFSFRLLAPAALAIALCGAPVAASAQSFNDAQRGEIQKIVKDYLLTHPEILEEVSAELTKRQTAAEAEKHAAAVSANADTIFNSPRGVTIGNKDGDVTFVEFFDYNCGYCKKAMTDMVEIMKDDPKLKVVLKEFPVLGPGSVEAAQVAVAVRMQDPTGKKYLASTRTCSAVADRLTRRVRWQRRRKPGSTWPDWKRISRAPRCAPPSRKTSSSPNRWV
jgi:protein-disulfide isomerase